MCANAQFLRRCQKRVHEGGQHFQHKVRDYFSLYFYSTVGCRATGDIALDLLQGPGLSEVANVSQHAVGNT